MNNQTIPEDEMKNEIVKSIYDAYGSDSGVLFGIKEPDIVKAIVEFTINRMTKNSYAATQKDNLSTPVDGDWVIEYDNDTGANDESFWEYWWVTNGDKSYQCKTNDDAVWLCGLLNKLSPPTPQPHESADNSKEALTGIQPANDAFQTLNTE